MSDTTKFVVTKGIANEYYITIKQDDSTLPMEIVTGTTNILETVQTIQPTYSTKAAVAYSPAVPAVEYVAPVAGQSYIAAVAGQPEIYKITAYVLNSDAATDGDDLGVTYNVQVNNTTFSKLYRKSLYSDIYKYFQAIAADINASAAVNTIVTATVDASVLVISGKTNGVAYTVNASSALYISEVQKAVMPVVGQPYIAPVEEVLAQNAIPEVLAQPEMYKRSDSTHTVTVTDPYAGRYARDSVVTIEGNGVHVEIDGIPVTPVNGVYDINTELTFNVVLDADASYSTSIPEDVTISILTSYVVPVDTFSAYIYKLNTGDKVATITQAGTADGIISVYDKNNGKLKVELSADLTNRLVAERGDRADYYYSKPMYRLVIDASTVNNGDFIATVDKVYVV